MGQLVLAYWLTNTCVDDKLSLSLGNEKMVREDQNTHALWLVVQARGLSSFQCNHLAFLHGNVHSCTL